MFEKSNQGQIITAQKSLYNTETSQINIVHKTLSNNAWTMSSIGLFVVLIGSIIYGKLQYKKLTKIIRYEGNKVFNLERRLNTALATIREWEENPDLITSRDCNLDYIRMRMQEPVFHNVLVNQAKVKVKHFISTAMRIRLAQNAGGRIASKSGFHIDETFDITYEVDSQEKRKRTRRVLFRIQVKLMKLPIQSSSNTIHQIVECVEMFLSPSERRKSWQSKAGRHERRNNWQPTIQGHIVSMSWNQQAKPTPLLLLEQHAGGVNVSFRTKVAKKYKTFASRNR